MFCTWANRIRTHVNARIPTGTSAYKRRILTLLILCTHKFCTWANCIRTHVKACSSTGISQQPYSQGSLQNISVQGWRTCILNFCRDPRQPVLARTLLQAKVNDSSKFGTIVSWFKFHAAHNFCTCANWKRTHVNDCSSAGISQCPSSQRSQHSSMRCQNELIRSRQCYHMLIAM